MSKELDQFYTSPKIVNRFLKIINKKININSKSILIEPSAGDGKFLDGFDIFFPNNKIMAYDIEKNHHKVKQQNFLNLSLSYNENFVVIGNPPFGHRSKLAIDFLNKSAEFSDVICFVLPIQFKRWGVQNKINQNLKLIYSSSNLPKNSFLYKNRSYNVNCLLQIWVNKHNKNFLKYKDLRLKKAPKNKHDDFQLLIYNNTKETLKYFNKKIYQWDFAIVRQGFYDYNEKIYDPFLLKENRQYLFIKCNNDISKQIMNLIDFEKLSNKNTTIKGFSNTDIIKEYEFIKRKIKNFSSST